MEMLIENIVIYSVTFILIGAVLFAYLSFNKKKSKKTDAKIKKAIEFGFHEPVSLHPKVDVNSCIGSGACIEACPEKDILGITNGKASTINASRCVGHGACFHACPVEAITLLMGTEKRGVELPHVSQKYQSNVEGIFIAGELGGMGLIKNAVEQGKLAMQNIAASVKKSDKTDADVIIIGAGPAGISATLQASLNGLSYITLEQDTLGGTVYSFPRAKIVMTSPMDLPLYGNVKLVETSKDELIGLWKKVLEKNNISINENEKVLSATKKEDYFVLTTNKKNYKTSAILLAIGRRGSPRKLGVPGENLDKVFYRLLEPELIKDKQILVVGGGDSAIESALLLSDEGNKVKLSYRGDSFARLKPKNLERIQRASENGKIELLMESNVQEIMKDKVVVKFKDNTTAELPNDYIYVFAGGILPNKFLEEMGIKITKKFGEVVLKH